LTAHLGSLGYLSFSSPFGPLESYSPGSSLCNPGRRKLRNRRARTLPFRRGPVPCSKGTFARANHCPLLRLFFPNSLTSHVSRALPSLATAIEHRAKFSGASSVGSRLLPWRAFPSFLRKNMSQRVNPEDRARSRDCSEVLFLTASPFVKQCCRVLYASSAGFLFYPIVILSSEGHAFFLSPGSCSQV